MAPIVYSSCVSDNCFARGGGCCCGQTLMFQSTSCGVVTLPHTPIYKSFDGVGTVQQGPLPL